MAITGVSSISGQQIIAAGALSAASAGTALFDENGNAITSYLTAVPTGYATSGDVTGTAQYGLTTAGWTEITGGGGGVSGTNVVFKPWYEGATDGDYYSANISGDVSVTTGQYGYDYINPRTTYSLSSIGNNLGNKLDKNKIEDSNTIAIIDNHAEVTGRAYRPTEFSDISAYNVDIRLHSLNVDFMSINAGLYSAIVIVETTASGEFIPENWSLVSYENNSATFTRYYPLNQDFDVFNLYADEGWGVFTNAEASATVYSAEELAPLAFKDEILSTADVTGTAQYGLTTAGWSEITGGGSTPAYGHTDNGLISAIDTSGLYASSGSASHLRQDSTMGGNIAQSSGGNTFLYMPRFSPWTTADVATGIFSPLQYATGACLAMDAGYFKAYFKGNEWYVSNTAIGQALRGEVHQSRGVHISGATTAGYGFDLGIKGVNGVNATGSWKYGPAEDAALRAVSSCDMHESAFSYDASDNITAYNGSAFKAGDEFPQSATEAIETVTANSGAWGGSALPISAGPGVKFEMVNDTLVASTDETVLWSGYSTGSAPAFNLSDDISAFSYIEFYAVDDDGWCGYTRVESDYCTTANRIPITIGHYGLGSKNFATRGIYVHPTSNTHLDSKVFGMDYASNAGENDKTHITKIVGINRIAGGN